MVPNPRSASKRKSTVCGINGPPSLSLAGSARHIYILDPVPALLRLRPFSVGRCALLRSRQKNMSQHIFRSSVELQNTREGGLRTLASFSVRERLARYGSSALSGVEHLRLLVGRDSAVNTLMGHFGSLKELE